MRFGCSILLLAGLLLAGCSSGGGGRGVSMTGNSVEATKVGLEGARKEDRVMWEYRLAGAAMREGKFDLAREELDAAALNVERVLKGKRSGEKKERERWRKYYVGDDHERVLACFYRGLLFWMDGDFAGAREEFRRGLEVDGGGADGKGDWVVLEWLSGMMRGNFGEDGRGEMEKAGELAKGISGVEVPVCEEGANVWVVVEFGKGPMRCAVGRNKEKVLYWVPDSGVGWSELEVEGRKVVLRPSEDVGRQALAGVVREAKKKKLNWVQRKMGKVSGAVGTAVALVGVEAVKDELFGTDDSMWGGTPFEEDTAMSFTNVGIGLGLVLVGGLINVAGGTVEVPERADERSWEPLPRYLSVCGVKLPEGEHGAVLRFFGEDGVELSGKMQEFVVNAGQGRDEVVFKSDVGRVEVAPKGGRWKDAFR